MATTRDTHCTLQPVISNTSYKAETFKNRFFVWCVFASQFGGFACTRNHLSIEITHYLRVLSNVPKIFWVVIQSLVSTDRQNDATDHFTAIPRSPTRKHCCQRAKVPKKKNRLVGHDQLKCSRYKSPQISTHKSSRNTSGGIIPYGTLELVVFVVMGQAHL